MHACDFFFLVIESRETNTQGRNQREGKTTKSLSDENVRRRCLVRLEKCTFASVLVRLKKKEERNNNEKTPTPKKKKTKRCSSVRESRQKQRR